MNTSEVSGKQARGARGVLRCIRGTPESPSVADVRSYLREFLWKPACAENVAPVVVAGAQPGESPHIHGAGGKDYEYIPCFNDQLAHIGFFCKAGDRKPVTPQPHHSMLFYKL